MIPYGSRLPVGEHYPHLHRANIQEAVHGFREFRPRTAAWQLPDQSVVDACDVEVLPTLVIEIPATDWQAIMEIYRAHWHAQNTNEAVAQAWTQYQLLVKLSQ